MQPQKIGLHAGKGVAGMSVASELPRFAAHRRAGTWAPRKTSRENMVGQVIEEIDQP